MFFGLSLLWLSSSLVPHVKVHSTIHCKYFLTSWNWVSLYFLCFPIVCLKLGFLQFKRSEHVRRAVFSFLFPPDPTSVM